MAICKHRVMDKCKKNGKPCCWGKDCFEPEEPKPMTNADRIRAMTDEELAALLAHETYRIAEPYFQYIGLGITEEVCYCQRLNWLKQPVEVE